MTETWSDWKNNVLQVFGASSDMRASMSAADKFIKGNPNNEITFVGHSKSGAEAMGNAILTNKRFIEAEYSIFGRNTNLEIVTKYLKHLSDISPDN